MTLRSGKPNAPTKSPLGNVESLARATLVGWGIGKTGGAVEIRVLAALRPVSFQLRRIERLDVRAAHPARGSTLEGFMAELEPAVWQDADADGCVALSVTLDGEDFPLPRSLDRTLLVDWWRELATEPPSPERERHALRLLAHVAAAGGVAGLPADTATAIEREVERRGLAPAWPGPAGVRCVERALHSQVRLERFTGLFLEGWAIDPANQPQAFRVLVAGAPLECRIHRTPRQDVQQLPGTATPEPGFRIELPPQVWAHADARGGCDVDAFVDGRRLTTDALRLDAADIRGRLAAAVAMPQAVDAAWLAALERHADAMVEHGWLSEPERLEVARLAPAAADAVASPDAGAVPAGREPRVVLESWEDLALVGWAVDEVEGGELFRLFSNWREVPCDVLRTQRGDVTRALGLSSGRDFVGFEIRLPIEIWRHADPDGACAIRLFVNGHPAGQPLRVDRPLLERAIGRRFGPASDHALLSADPDTVRGRSLAWHLACHVDASGGDAALGLTTRQQLARGNAWLDAARAHGVFAGHDGPERDEHLLQRRVWRLQRRLNLLLAQETPDVAVDAVLRDVDARGAVRSRLLLSLVPLMCEYSSVSLRIEAELPIEMQAVAAANGDNWHRSLFLVALARAGRFAQAEAVLARIVAAPSAGWLNTECLAFAVRAALRPPTGAADDDAVPRERFIDGFVELVDALPGGYWSRHHDRWLVEACAAVVSACGAWAADRTRRCVGVALRHYGLVPSFWAALDRSGVPADAVLARGREDFDCVRKAFSRIGGRTDDGTAWREAVERLRVQVRNGRGDALQWLRELMLADLAAARSAGRGEDPFWRFVWEATAPAELPRLEAFPMHAPAADAQPQGPRSLWPTPDALPVAGDAPGSPENRLDLRSEPARVAALADARVLAVCVVRNEEVMLPHFLAHYRRLGVRHFVFVDNGSDDGTVPFLEAQPDVVLYAAPSDYRDSHYGVAWQQAVLAAHAPGRWALVADADELLLYPGCETVPLADVLDRLEASGNDAARVLMLDMYPQRPLRDVDFARQSPTAADRFDREPLLHWRLGGGLYSNGPTWLSALRHRLIPHSPPNAFTAQKIALLRYRPWVRLSEGLHYAAGLSPASEPLFFAHYKYHAGFREKVLLEIERKQHYDGASEYVHYLSMVAEPDASLFEPGISVPLADSRALPSIGAAAAAGD